MESIPAHGYSNLAESMPKRVRLSTDEAISGLTSEIGRVPVLFTVYGRS
ncbi:3216_t:CDS:2 [Ambispora leptoticha]|uniref:3216_t:CDS:1 n=1 Tax=Ambispora leptoticha TaxID=144679 RepID=A0A9N9FCQ3_9GLOM|nr:3216_t:CDS:2 [Ambispora leptoticha]